MQKNTLDAFVKITRLSVATCPDKDKSSTAATEKSRTPHITVAKTTPSKKVASTPHSGSDGTPKRKAASDVAADKYVSKSPRRTTTAVISSCVVDLTNTKLPRSPKACLSTKSQAEKAEPYLATASSAADKVPMVVKNITTDSKGNVEIQIKHVGDIAKSPGGSKSESASTSVKVQFNGSTIV